MNKKKNTKKHILHLKCDKTGAVKKLFWKLGGGQTLWVKLYVESRRIYFFKIDIHVRVKILNNRSNGTLYVTFSNFLSNFQKLKFENSFITHSDIL